MGNQSLADVRCKMHPEVADHIRRGAELSGLAVGEYLERIYRNFLLARASDERLSNIEEATTLMLQTIVKK